MRDLLKGAAITMAAITLLAVTVYAAADIPVRKTFENEGYTVTWNQETKTVTLERDGIAVSEPVGENIVLDYDTTYTTKEFADSVRENYANELFSTTATVKEAGEGYFLADTEKLGEVIFMIDENTALHFEDNTAATVEKDAVVKVYFANTMTLSLPPQTYAKEVIVKNAQPAVLTTEGVVESVGDEYFTVKTADEEVIRFNVGEETFFHHIINRRFYTFEDIEEGMTVEVKHSPAMTFSIPPQSFAKEVVIK